MIKPQNGMHFSLEPKGPNVSINPFFELYVGDRLSSSEFVDIFSPFLVSRAEALFAPGNVVVKGIQGSGKSMLLSLLKSDVRKGYAQAKTPFPVPPQLGNFIGAGINLAHSNAIDFGYRSISNDPNESALFFGDFVNYTILLNLFESIHTLSDLPHSNDNNLHIDLSTARIRDFVSNVVAADIFQGALDGCQEIVDIEERISSRLNAYRRFLHANDEVIDSQIRMSKTNIGEPISTVARMLKEAGVIGDSVAIFIHVDQYEELSNIPLSEENDLDYRRVINRALARRDPAVSYRIGTRGHAWRNHGYIFGANAKLEEERDYKFVDLDEMLKRHENRKTWVFPRFVEDVFKRRLIYANFAGRDSDGKDLLKQVFGNGIKAKKKAEKYGGSSRHRSVKVDPDWPKSFQKDITALAEEDPLSARLLEAWVLQQLDSPSSAKKGILPRDLSVEMLADMNKKTWWKKERIELALIQIASRCQERPLWSGFEDIIGLSGVNILTFLSICQFIWDTRNQVGVVDEKSHNLEEIDFEVQAVGIFKASGYWLQKIKQETGRSGDRFRLARQVGKVLEQNLHADRKMSYPGHNGFSLADDDLERFPHVKELLEEMSDYGTFSASVHTTKEKNRKSRKKFYLSPILCPQFKITYKRLKEPSYIRATEVEKWMKQAGLPVPVTHQSQITQIDTSTMPLFDDEENEPPD